MKLHSEKEQKFSKYLFQFLPNVIFTSLYQVQQTNIINAVPKSSRGLTLVGGVPDANASMSGVAKMSFITVCVALCLCQSVKFGALFIQLSSYLATDDT